MSKVPNKQAKIPFTFSSFIFLYTRFFLLWAYSLLSKFLLTTKIGYVVVSPSLLLYLFCLDIQTSSPGIK